MIPAENVVLAPRVRFTKCSCGTVRRERVKQCGLSQLTLSYAARTRLRLRELVTAAGIPQGEFAKWVLGCDPVTICAYLAGAVIPKTRAFQINRIERVVVVDGLILVELRDFRLNPRWRARKTPIVYPSSEQSFVRGCKQGGTGGR